MSPEPPLDRGSFDPETTTLLITAFERSWETVLRSGSVLAKDDQAALTRESLAKFIIGRVQAGERGLENLISDALAHLALPR
jgi:hypothetical protein